MGKSLSLDIRERVVSLVDEGLSCHEAARRMRISAASAVRIMQRKKRTGEVTAEPQGRPRRSKLDAVSGCSGRAWTRSLTSRCRSWPIGWRQSMGCVRHPPCCRAT